MGIKGLMPLEGPATRQTVDKKKEITRAEGRKTRWDKQIEVKFPVTPYYEEHMIYFYKNYKRQYGDALPGMAVFNSMLLRFALRTPGIVDDDIEYVTSKTYKRVYVNQIENEKIDGLEGFTTSWRMSKREVIHRLVLSSLHYLLKGGELAYEKTIPLKPAK